MKRLTDQVVYGLAASLAVTLALGCSSEDDPKGGGGSGGSGGTPGCNGLNIAFTPMYSAYDGVHTFQVPAIVRDVSGASITWSASDTSKVSIENDTTTGGAMITVLQAGTVTIEARSAGNLCGSSLLTITQATPAEWDAGDTRYNNGNPLAEMGVQPGGVPAVPDGGANLLEIPGKPAACTNCHGTTATTEMFKTVSHTPTQTAGFSDEQLIAAFTQGELPEGAYFATDVIPQSVWKYFHKWTATEQERKGLVIYLRSLTPKAQGGSFDFGGRPRDAGR
jgi:hypothetical protein